MCSNAFAGTIILEGKYQKRNIYVQNGLSAAGIGFCTFEVRVNGNVTTDETNSSAFEIDLSTYGFDLGEPIVISISHKDDCLPKILNPEVIKPVPTFETTNIQINRSGLLSWSTINEGNKMPFIIEQFKWNKWIKVGEVEGLGGHSLNDYSFQTNAVSGLNKFRVKQEGYIDKVRYSKTVSYISTIKEINYVYIRKEKTVVFSEETSFEVFDAYGNLIKKGFNEKISMQNVSPGDYYVNFGNTMVEIKVKS